MRRYIILTVTAVLVAVMATTVSAAGPGRASGSGHSGAGDERRTFAFTAVQRADGSATGQAHLDARAFPARVHTKITCLRVEGTTAYLSGVNTSADPDFFEGVWVIFGVRDLGKGPGIDQITSFQPAAEQGPDACMTESPTDWMSIERGNITVR